MTHNQSRAKISQSRRCVVKIGSALLTDAKQGIDVAAIGRWVEQAAKWMSPGRELLLVTSGSVAAGLHRMGGTTRPHALHDLQALAAIGQMGLVQTYETAFHRFGIHSAQILLTHADLANRERYLNARSTLKTLLKMGVVPVINENDTVATEEIRFSDNDTLAAQVCNLVEADLLVILTDQEGLFEQDPRECPDARLVSHGQAGDPSLVAMAGGSGSLGRGGMRTKVLAAGKAARSGTCTVIANGRKQDVLSQVWAGESVGTYLEAAQGRVAARKQWLASQAKTAGRLVLDAGAVRVVRENGGSLLAVGVIAAEGKFSRGEVVACVDADGNEVARGLVNYGIDDTRKILGKPSERIESLLGYVDDPELIHRDNMVLV
ncbi:MAG: glutamate 5-kinase [Gammaproteobacteria bacterium]|nr:glutamate 5-kinase [Gammaproteobacteria bacterium]